MTSEDLKYLKRSTPAELLLLCNEIPWEFCALLKVELTQPTLTFEQRLEAAYDEQGKWLSGCVAPSDPAELNRWIKTHSAEALKHCDECKIVWPGLKVERRINFDKKQGFAWLNLCGQCTADWDNHFDPAKWAANSLALAVRWQGRCLTPREIAQ
jgi:hypothetical protein